MRADDGWSFPAHAMARRIARFGLAVLLLAGCGAELYEERLAATKSMFAHQDQLNQNLQGIWGDPETGISLRVPTQFALLPAPVKPVPGTGAANPAEEKDGEKPKEEGEDEVLDDRQPSYINIGLPGLRGAFRAPLKYAGENNAVGDGDGFVYVLSNQHLAEQPDQAKDFEKQVVQALSEGLHVTVEPTDWRDDRFPPEAKAKASFVNSIPYKTVTITSGEEISGYFREFSAYMFDKGDIQVVVLFVLPKDVDSSEKLNERIPLCLETLVVSGDKLMAPTPGGAPAPGAAPAASF